MYWEQGGAGNGTTLWVWESSGRGTGSWYAVLTLSSLSAGMGGDATMSSTGVVTIKFQEKTVATLPTCNSGAKDVRFAVTDATSPTYLGTLTGGGTVYAPVVCNGTAWVSY